MSLPKEIVCKIFHDALIYHVCTNIIKVDKYYREYCTDIIVKYRHFVRTGFIYNLPMKLIFVSVEKLIQVMNMAKNHGFTPCPSRVIRHYILPISFEFKFIAKNVNIYIESLTIIYFSVRVELYYNKNKLILSRGTKYKDIKPVLDFLQVYMRDIYTSLIT